MTDNSNTKQINKTPFKKPKDSPSSTLVHSVQMEEFEGLIRKVEENFETILQESSRLEELLLLQEVNNLISVSEGYENRQQLQKENMRYIHVACGARDLLEEHAPDVPIVGKFLELFEDMLDGNIPPYLGQAFVVMDTGEEGEK